MYCLLMRSVLFLDFDGVLNSDAFLHPKGIKVRFADELDPKAIERLNQIVKRTGCDVVISSSWRYGHTKEELEKILKECGYTGTICDVTPLCWDGATRGREIQIWIASQTEKPKHICILDDYADMDHLADKLVRTTWAHGLQDVHIELCVKKLTT
jgi:hypothetical protein